MASRHYRTGTTTAIDKLGLGSLVYPCRVCAIRSSLHGKGVAPGPPGDYAVFSARLRSRADHCTMFDYALYSACADVSIVTQGDMPAMLIVSFNPSSTPESQGIISTSVTALPRQNLQEVGKLVEAIATGRYRVPSYDVNMFATLEGYIQDAIPAFSDWILTCT
jgi:hypothetical protein